MIDAPTIAKALRFFDCQVRRVFVFGHRTLVRHSIFDGAHVGIVRFIGATIFSLLFCLSALAQGSITGQEVSITYTGTNISVVQPNTPVTQFNAPNGTNTFIIPLPSPTVSLRFYITNNTANACPNAFTAQLWAASDPQVSSFNKSPQNWQVVPMQSTGGTLVQTITPSVPATGAAYFSSAVISAPKVVLQLVSAGGLCTTTNVEVTAVVNNVSVTSPLISANSPQTFNNGLGNNVQGVVPQDTTGSQANPLIGGGLELPINQSYLAVGIDTFSNSQVSLANGTAGTFSVGTIPNPTQDNELAIAFVGNIPDTTSQTIVAPWTAVQAASQSCGTPNICNATLLVASLSNPQAGQKLSETWLNSTGGTNLLTTFVLVQTPGVTVRTASANTNNGASIAYATNTLAGSLLIYFAECTRNALACAVSSVADTQGHTWTQLPVNNVGGTAGVTGISVWIATTTSTAAADTVTPTLGSGTLFGQSVVEVPGVTTSFLNQPAISVQVDPTGAEVTRQDAQFPNQFVCNVTLSTNTTTQCQGVPGTINGVPVRLYITDIQVNTTTAGTATTIQIVGGTGTNCGTGTVNLSAITYANTSIGLQSFLGMRTPIFTPSLGQEACVKQAGTTAGTSVVELHGFLAP